MAPHMSYGAPSALWHPSAILAPTSAFWCAPFAFCKPHLPFGSPIIFDKTHDKMSGSHKGPCFSILSLQFVDDIIIMRNCQSALAIRMCLDPSHHFVWAHKGDFSLRSSTWNIFWRCPKKAKYFSGKAHMKVVSSSLLSLD
jgi:hypothetical protein